MPLSAYELERLANIAANQAKLDELGLGDAEKNKLKAPPPPKRKRDESSIDVNDDKHPIRRSLRVSNTQVSYLELSDEFCLREEKLLAAMDRKATHPHRKRSAPASYSDEQAAGILSKEASNVLKKRAKLAALQRVAVPDAFALRPPIMVTTSHFTPANVITVDGQTKGRCPRCGQFWALRKDKTIRDHSCIPLSQSVTPHLPAI